MQGEKYPLDFILLNIGFAEHHADWNWKDIKSPFARLHLISKGSAKIHRDGQTYLLRENHLYLTPSYTAHSYECDADVSLYYMHIYEKMEKRSSIFENLHFPVEIESDELMNSLIERLKRINPKRELSIFDPKSYDNTNELIRNIALQNSTPIALELESRAIIKLLLARFVAQSQPKSPQADLRIVRVLDYIHANIHSTIGIDKLAALSCLTKDHLIRSFKKQVNCTPGHYINRKKIEKAQLLILLENPSIQELSYKLGFENVSYFNRLFKKLTGESPRSYKKRLTAQADIK